MLGLSSIVYESKSISLNIYTDLQLPNFCQHLSNSEFNSITVTALLLIALV